MGPEALVTTRRHGRIESGELTVRGRAGMFTQAGLGVSFEAATSVATNLMRVVPAGSAGVLVNIVVVEVGVLGQWSITKRPDWIPAPWLAVRLHIPESWPH